MHVPAQNCFTNQDLSPHQPLKGISVLVVVVLLLLLVLVVVLVLVLVVVMHGWSLDFWMHGIHLDGAVT